MAQSNVIPKHFSIHNIYGKQKTTRIRWPKMLSFPPLLTDFPAHKFQVNILILTNKSAFQSIQIQNNKLPIIAMHKKGVRKNKRRGVNF